MPNTPVPATGEATPVATINRRQIVGGISALTFVSAPSVAGEHPDAELLRLDEAMKKAHSRMMRADRAVTKAYQKLNSELPPPPVHPNKWKSPNMPAHLEAMSEAAMQGVLVRDFMKMEWQPEPVRAWFADSKKKEAEVQAAWDDYRALRDEKARAVEYDAKGAAFRARLDELWDIGLQIFATPAQTVDGLAVKLRAYDRIGPEEGAQGKVFQSISDDIRRLAAAGNGEAA